MTAAQDRMHFCSFDVTTDDRDDVVAMLKEWTGWRSVTLAEEAVSDGAVGLNP